MSVYKKKNAKKILSGESGAASVMVMLVMIVLVTLGAFAVTSANVNYKLSVQALNWNETYYDLDSRAEEALAKIDEKLMQAETETEDYVFEKYYSAVTNEFSNDFYGNYAKMFFENADNELNALKDEYDGLTVTETDSDGGGMTKGLAATVTLYADNDGQNKRGLTFSVDIMLKYDQAGNVINEKRYEITEWREFQEAVGGP